MGHVLHRVLERDTLSMLSTNETQDDPSKAQLKNC